MKDIQMIPIEKLEQHPDNPRKTMDPEKIQELAASIRANGVLQNLTVVPHLGEYTGIPTGFYRVIIGHRRLEACKLAGIREVPCMVTEMSPGEQFRTMMVENMQRADLTPIEEAEGFQLMLDMGDSVADISRDTGMSETTVRRRLSIGTLPREAARAGLEKGATLDDYLAVTKIKDPKKQEKALAAIGTPDFRQTVKYQLDAEKKAEYLKQLREAVESADWMRKVEDAPYSDWEYVTKYGAWSVGRLPERPEDADVREYVYTERTRDSYSIHRKKDKTGLNPKADKIRQIRTKAQDELRAVFEELEELEDEFRELREEFIMEFDRVKRHSEEIMAMASTCLLRDDGDVLDNEEALTAMGLGVNEADAPGKEVYAKMLKEPEKRLLWLVYLSMEGSAGHQWHRMYEADLQASYPVFNRSEPYEYMYKMLQELGYAVSKEEEAYLQGACMAYDEGKAIRDKYLEELKKAL